MASTITSLFEYGGVTVTESELEIHLGEALHLVTTEREEIDKKLKAFDRFAVGVSRISAGSEIGPTVRNAIHNGNQEPLSVATQSIPDNDTRIQKVRSLFAKTVRPHSVEDIEQPEPLLVTIREEFSEEIALALAPSTNQQFTENLKSAILSSVDQCQSKLKAMDKGLTAEKRNLEKAISLSQSLNEWLVSEWKFAEREGFDALKDQHEQLNEFRDQCEQLAVDRQSTIHTKRNNTLSADLSHSMLVDYLYQPLPVTYPILSASMQMIDVCDTQQRTIRMYLTQCM